MYICIYHDLVYYERLKNNKMNKNDANSILKLVLPIEKPDQVRYGAVGIARGPAFHGR